MKKSFLLYLMACLLFASASTNSAPTIKIIGIGGGAGNQIDPLDLSNGKTKPEITVQDSSGTQCINIAGRWHFSENGTFTCESEGEAFTDPINDTGTIDILQNGCHISYTGPGPDAIKRTGQINGNMVTLSGVLVPSVSGGVTLSENSFTATGAVNALDQFTLGGTGLVKGTDSGIPFSCTLNSIGKFTRASALRNKVECLLNWAENNYSNLFSPAGATSQFQSPYTYRYYSGTNSYVGVSASNYHVYYLGPDGVLVDVGDLSGWLARASCQ